MASEEEVVRFIFNGANEMAELMYQLIKWALERREKGRDDGRRDPSKISGRIAPEDAASFAADLAAAGIGAEYVAQADGGLVYSCDAKHFETLKALTKGYAAKYDAMHPESVDNVYYETLRDWRGCSLNECFEVASTVEVAAVNKMRADLAAMGVYFEVARRPENLGYVVKFNAKDASMVERALCELDQAYGHPQSAQDVARDLDGRKAGDYTLTMTTVEWDRAANIMGGPMEEDGIPFSLSFDEAAETASLTFASEHAAGVKAIADRYIKSSKENLKDFTTARFEDWDEFCEVAETGMVRDDALQAIRAEWIDVGDGRYSLEAYANAWDAEAVVGVSVYAKAVVESDPSLEGWEVWGNADGPNFGERGFDDLAEAMEYAESLAAGELAERGYEVAVGSRPEAPAQERGEAAPELDAPARQERTVEQADYVVEPRDVGPSETVETVVAATKSAEVADDAGEAHIGSSLEEMTNPDGLDLPSIERFGSAEKLDGAKIGDVLQACSKDVKMIKAQLEAKRQQGVERGAKAAVQSKGAAR